MGNPHDNTECVTILLAPGVAFHPPRVVKIKFLAHSYNYVVAKDKLQH